MKVLMFGWEFPPHISGGLGTACHGLTHGLSELNETGVIFVVPRTWGDEANENFELVGANHVPVIPGWTELQNPAEVSEYLIAAADIVPYTTPEEFWRRKNQPGSASKRFIKTDESGCIEFSGNYGPDLYQEIRNYAVVAGMIAQQKQFDVIHAHDWLSFPAGITASRISQKPLIVHVHATDFDRTGGNISSRIYSIEREGMEKADKVVTVSNQTRKTVIEKYGIPPGKVITIYNAVKPHPSENKPSIKKDKTVRTVTFLGRVTMQKGPEYFVEAASMVLKYLPDVRFIMAGSGDMMNMTIEHVARLGIADRFHFTGFLDEIEVQRLLSMSDILVMPSVSEPFGMVSLEAMMAGVPVIISKQSGVSEVVNYVFKIDFWDTSSLANAIYGLLRYPVLWKLFSGKGVTEASKLDWKKTAEKVNLLYQEVIRQHYAGDPYVALKKNGSQKLNAADSEPTTGSIE